MNPIIVIPARLASSRFPDKILVDIKGKPMLQHVWEKAIAANIGDVLVACDCQQVEAVVQDFGGEVVVTNPEHPSGSDRIYEALTKINSAHDYIINLQCDLPTIDPAAIRAVLKPFTELNIQISTLANKFESLEEATDPNNVKIAIAFKQSDMGKALYFSRAVIPFGAQDIYHHIGMYAYTRQGLERFVSLRPSALELSEKLEQLRALEDGMSIGVTVINSNIIGVDTPEDLKRVMAGM